MTELQLCQTPLAFERPPTARRKHPWPVIDMHCHALSKDASALAARLGFTPAHGSIKFASEASRRVAQLQRDAIAPKLTTMEARLSDMDAAGIDIQVVSPVPNQYYYDAEPEIGQALARQVNETIAALVAKQPKRFVGLGTVPMQSPELAVQELRYAVKELGLRGLEIGTNVNGTDLDAAAFAPFFSAAEELGVVLFLHPAGFTDGNRLSEYFLNNIIGNPLESTIALSRMIMGGVFERHGSLKLCVAHGGGYLPAYAGRMEHAYHSRSECRTCLQHPPSTSLKRIYFDTLVHSKEQLAQLVRTYGAKQLLMGSDYPYDMGQEDPMADIDGLDCLDDESRALVMGGNAARLLQLDIEKLNNSNISYELA